jgi:hypothetical protein
VGAIADEDRGVAMSIRKGLGQGSSLYRNRKGFTYLLVTSFMVVIILMLFFSENRYKYQDQENLQQVRIRAMNDFMRNLDTDIHRASYISAFRSMLALEDYVTTTGQYLSDINSSFKETFFYGTVNFTNSTIMQNSTFHDYLLKVQSLAWSTGIVLNMNVTNIRMSQSDPWTINVYVILNITATDAKNTASWNINTEYVTEIPIENLRDPLYSKNTLNRVPNTIRRLDTAILVDGMNTTNLQTHINGSYYLASTYAPNFVMRFEGRVDSDPNGIESIVDIKTLSNQEITVYEDRVKVDYIYFNDLFTDEICDVETISSDAYFIIPSNRINLYQIASLNYTTPCP